jgi:hypothetical protein
MIVVSTDPSSGSRWPSSPAPTKSKATDAFDQNCRLRAHRPGLKRPVSDRPADGSGRSPRPSGAERSGPSQSSNAQRTAESWPAGLGFGARRRAQPRLRAGLLSHSRGLGCYRVPAELWPAHRQSKLLGLVHSDGELRIHAGYLSLREAASISRAYREDHARSVGGAHCWGVSAPPRPNLGNASRSAGSTGGRGDAASCSAKRSAALCMAPGPERR